MSLCRYYQLLTPLSPTLSNSSTLNSAGREPQPAAAPRAGELQGGDADA